MRSRITLAAVIVVSLSACTSRPRGESRERTLIVGVPDDAATLDGVFASTTRSLEVIMNTYETLLTYGWEMTEEGYGRWIPDRLEGAVLEEMELGEDGLVWSLRVRPGVRFPSGREITAETVKFLFDRNFDVPGSGGKFMYGVIGRISGPDSVKVLDRYRLAVKTESPNPLLPRILVLSNGTPVDPVVVRDKSAPGEEWAESWLRQNTAGAGAYRLVRWIPGVEIVLAANPEYWRGTPDIRRVVMKVVPSAADRIMLLAAGYLDVAEGLSAEEIDTLSRTEGVRVISIPSTNAVQLIMNNESPPFDDVRVRKALGFAVPYGSIIRDVYFGRAQKTAGPVPVGFPGRDAAKSPYRESPEKARRLLAEAGYPTGLSVDLALDSGQPDHEAIAVLLQSSLARLGIEVAIQKLTPAVFAERRASRRLPLFLNETLWWVDDPAYPLLLGYVSGGFLNHALYHNDDVDRLVKRAATELDHRERSRMLAEAERIIIEGAPMIWIAQPHFALATREAVHGYVHFNDEMVRFQYLGMR